MTPIKTFDIKEFVRKQKQEKLQNAGLDGNSSSPAGGGAPFGMNPFGGGMPGMGSDMDIDKMIKEIDAKIAELEKEEEEEKKKQEAEKNKEIESEEKIIDKPAPEPESIKSNSKEEKLFDTRNISTDPNVNEIIHSNMVDFENFKIKDDKEKMDNENKEEPKNNVKKDNDSDYDDFFDDFFFEE